MKFKLWQGAAIMAATFVSASRAAHACVANLDYFAFEDNFERVLLLAAVLIPVCFFGVILRKRWSPANYVFPALLAGSVVLLLLQVLYIYPQYELSPGTFPDPCGYDDYSVPLAMFAAGMAMLSGLTVGFFSYRQNKSGAVPNHYVRALGTGILLGLLSGGPKFFAWALGAETEALFDPSKPWFLLVFGIAAGVVDVMVSRMRGERQSMRSVIYRIFLALAGVALVQVSALRLEEGFLNAFF